MEKKIQISKESFQHSIIKEKRNYLFVLEDRKEKKIVGSSQILSYFWERQPLCYLLTKKQGKNYLQLCSPPTKPASAWRTDFASLLP